MNPEADEEPFYPFTSHDCIDVIFDGEGDTTVRPLRPALMKLALERRAKEEAWRKALEEEKKGRDLGPQDKHAD